MTARPREMPVGIAVAVDEEAVMGKQTMRQVARLAASQVQAKRRREQAERDRRLEKLAIEVLTALGERDATIAATERPAGAALQAMITDESLTVSEVVQWCAGAISHREACRLRQLTGQADNNKPEDHGTTVASSR